MIKIGFAKLQITIFNWQTNYYNCHFSKLINILFPYICEICLLAPKILSKFSVLQKTDILILNYNFKKKGC